MGDFLKIGKDTKYCKIRQGSITVIFPYATEKLDAQPILAQNTRPGFNPSQSNNTQGRVTRSISGLLERIGNNRVASPQDKGTPRGTTIRKIGNAGYKINIDGSLTGDYYIQRNKLLQIINSGEPCNIYLSRFQTIVTSGKLSDVNTEIRARNGFWATLLVGSGISESNGNIAGCDVKIIAQEVRYSQKIAKSTLDDYLNPLLDIIGDVAIATDTAKTFLREINGNLTQALGIISNLGSEINDIIDELIIITDTIDDLLQTPDLLKAQYSSIVGNIRNLGNKISRIGNATQNDINKQKTLYNFASNLAVYKSSTAPGGTNTTVNGSSLINVDAIKQNLVNGKLVNFQRYNGFSLMLSIAQNSIYSTADEVDNMINDLKTTYSFISSDTSYNGVVLSDVINPALTDDARNHTILSILYESMYTVLNQLRDIKQNLSNQSYVTSQDTNLWNIISERYIGLIENGASLSNIAERLYVANHLSSYNDIIPSNTRVLLPSL